MSPRTVIDQDVDVEKLVPTQDHLLVKVLDREMTAGGIHLPKNEATPCRVGKVLARGKAIPNSYDGRDFPIKCEAGDYVMFMDYAGERLRVAWKDYRLIREHGLWARVELSTSGDIVDFEAIHPWADRIVLERIDETMTKTGRLYLPNADLKMTWNVGTVKWSGFGLWHQSSGKLLACETKPGDRVIFKRYSGADLSVRGKEYRITQEVDVCAIIDGKGKDERLRPLRNRLVIEREKADDRSAGGLIIPDVAKTKHSRGTVVALGEGGLIADGSSRAWEVEVGARVVFKEEAGMEVEHNGVQYVICASDQLLSVVD